MDETRSLEEKNRQLMDLVSMPGWRIVREMFSEHILSLQNVSEYIDIIQTGNATKLLKEMKANKRVAEILFDVLRQVDGGAQQAIDEMTMKRPKHIFRLDNDGNELK